MNTFQKKTTCLLILFVSMLSTMLAQTSNKIDWKEDLQIYKASLEDKHIDLYHSVTEEEFNAEWSKIYDSIGLLNDFEITLKLMQLTRLINDGHTAVSLRNYDIHDYPFKIKHIENQWRVVKINNTNKNLLKSTLVAIDDVPIDKVMSKVSKVAQFVENEHSLLVRTGNYATISELLYALGITKKSNSATFTFQDINHQSIDIRLDALNQTTSNSDSFQELVIGIPEIIKPENLSFEYLWYAPIQNTNAVYIRFDSYPSFEKMQRFSEELLGFISKNKIEKIVIDMRNNGGGDLYVGIALAYALNLSDTVDWKQGVYVMTDAVTFSAGTSNSALFKQLLNAKIIGQPTGSKPTGYQDMDQFELPNSKLVITYSKRRFNLSETVTQGIYPDVILNYNWKDYQNGLDTMLLWVIKDIKKKE